MARPAYSGLEPYLHGSSRTRARSRFDLNARPAHSARSRASMALNAKGQDSYIDLQQLEPAL